jgi:opacity protein-like surface antigen
MKRGLGLGLIALVVGVFCMPGQAQAKGYINPWTGVVFGNDAAASGFHTLGVSFGDAGHGLVGTETNVGFSSGFFGTGVENYVLDFMGGVTVGPTFFTKTAKRDIRPYGVAEVGTIRTSISSDTGPGLARNNIGFSIGGGAQIEVSDIVAVRGDVRYLRSLKSDAAVNSLNVNLADFHYWRAAIGVLIH